MSAQAETSFSISNMTTGGSTVGSTYYVGNPYPPWYEQTRWVPSTYTYYWPSYQPDKTKQAFDVLKVLEQKGLIKLTSVKKFIELIDEIYKVL